jgi:GT2 family glycosyltransferase
LVPLVQQSYKDIEIIIVKDRSERLRLPKDKRIRLITFPGITTSPAVKRDFALKKIKGDICAFIDDDAYPASDWIEKAVKCFRNKKIIAVGGPGITPPEDGYWERLSGLVYESYYCSGEAQYRFVPLSPRYVVDYPAYNLFVLTTVLKNVGGFGNTYYGGEDTFLCLKLMAEGKLYYSGKVIVYHHRRSLFKGLWRQISNVGLHRGYFAVKYPETSRRWFYFIPSLLTLLLLLGFLLCIVHPELFVGYLSILLFFVLLGASSVVTKTDPISALLVGLGIISVHISYGLYFIKGLTTNNLRN